MKKLLLIVGCTTGFIVIAVVVFSWLRPPSNARDERLQVVATFYSLAYLASQVGGDAVVVTTVVPAGVEPHDYSPSPQSITDITQADVFIYNGAGLDSWAETISLSDFSNPKVQLIDTANIVLPLSTPSEGGAAVVPDPHFWLDPMYMQALVQQIAKAYSMADPTHASTYESNAQRLRRRLTELDQQYRSTLAHCSLRTAIVAHDAFSYLAQRYQLTLIPIVGMNPHETPSARSLSDLATLARTNSIHYIFFEELASPRLSEVLAEQVGAQTLVLSPLEGLSVEEQAQNEDYFSIMQRNLDNLTVALQCEL